MAYTVSEMQYDGTNRRTVNAAINHGGLDVTEHFYYDNQWRIIEQRNGSGWVARQVVWGQMYIDELIQIGMNGEAPFDTEFDPDSPWHDPLWYYAFHDANFNIIATGGYNGLERYEYTPYGQRTVYLNAGANDSTAHAATILSRRGTPSFLDAWRRNPFGHQGLYHDELTGLVQNRYRMLHPGMKRFMQRDPLEYIDGPNMYAYVGNSPPNFTDAEGLYRNLRNCNRTQLNKILPAESNARNKASTTYRLVRGRGKKGNKIYVDDGGPWRYSYNVRDKMGKRYPTLKNLVGTRAELYDKFTLRLAVTFKNIDSGFKANNYDIECECSCSSGKQAYVWSWGDTIHICPSFFTANELDRNLTFLHEASHLFANTNDRSGIGDIQNLPYSAYYVENYAKKPVSEILLIALRAAQGLTTN